MRKLIVLLLGVLFLTGCVAKFDVSSDVKPDTVLCADLLEQAHGEKFSATLAGNNSQFGDEPFFFVAYSNADPDLWFNVSVEDNALVQDEFYFRKACREAELIFNSELSALGIDTASYAYVDSTNAYLCTTDMTLDELCSAVVANCKTPDIKSFAKLYTVIPEGALTESDLRQLCKDVASKLPYLDSYTFEIFFVPSSKLFVCKEQVAHSYTFFNRGNIADWCDMEDLAASFTMTVEGTKS